MDINVGDLVEVDWVDSFGEDGWMHRNDAIPTSPLGICHSAGYVLADMDGWLTLTNSFSRCGSVYGYLSIPRVAITEVRVLVEKRMTLED